MFGGCPRPAPPPGARGGVRSVSSPPRSLFRGLGFPGGALGVERSNLLAQDHKGGSQIRSSDVEIGGFFDWV